MTHLHRKYDVRRADGSPRHKDCWFFVLDIKHDPYARIALNEYADLCARSAPQMSAQLKAMLAVTPLEGKPDPEVGGSRCGD